MSDSTVTGAPPAAEAPRVARRQGPFQKLISTIGPGLFVLGYTIGTGSVTAMATSGASFGMGLAWAVALSCLFTFFAIVGISRVTIGTARPFVGVVAERFGLPLGIFLAFGLMLTVITSVIGVTAIVSDVVETWSRGWLPGGGGIPSVVVAAAIICGTYGLFWTGSHKRFLQGMSLIVGLMSLCFISATVLLMMSPTEVLSTAVPMIPEGDDGLLILAGMIGTTMASVVIVARSYIVRDQGWTLADMPTERRDAAIALFLTFVVSAAVMASAAGTMHVLGLRVDNAIDMVRTLEPLAGDFATAIFVLGIMAAAISSLFPNYVLGPWLLLDLLGRERDLRAPHIRLLVLAVALCGLIVPVFGGRPVPIMIASQAISPVVMPLMLVLMLVLLNTREQRRSVAARWLNVGLGVALFFSVFASYAALVGLF